MKLLLDHNYYVFTASVFPALTQGHLIRIEEKMADFVYHTYLSTTTDQIPKYKSSADVDVSTNAGNFTIDELNINYITISHGSRSHMIFFITNGENTVVFINSKHPQFLVSLIESLDFQDPVILKSSPISSSQIPHVVNSLEKLISTDPLVLGNIDITYSPKQKLTNDLLKELLINVPAKDSRRLFKEKQMALDAILSWLQKTTTLDFTHLDILAFTSDFLSISKNGRIRLASDNLNTETMKLGLSLFISTLLDKNNEQSP